MKKQWPALKVYAVERTQSPAISSGVPSPHPIKGIGAGVIQVEAVAAREYARCSACEAGVLVRISSGETLAVIAQKLTDISKSAVVLGFNYDTGECYLSVAMELICARDRPIYHSVVLEMTR